MLIDEYNDIKQHVLSNNADLCKELTNMNCHLPSDAGTSANNLNDKILKNNLYPIELSNNVKIYFEPLARKFY